MHRILSITKDRFSICLQKHYLDFYLQFDYEKKYFLHRFFSTKLNGGIVTKRNIDWGSDPYTNKEWWIETMSIGFGFDTTVLNFRFGIYIYPVVYEINKGKKMGKQ